MSEHKVTATGQANRYHPVRTEDGTTLLSLLYKVALIRCFIKWIVHLLTGTCQLQRILVKSSGGVRTIRVEQCLRRSKFTELRCIVEMEPDNIDGAVQQIMQVKGIYADSNPRFFATLRICLNQIHGFESLFREVDLIRTEKYDSNNESHEKLLTKLWSLLRPDQALESRVSRQWTDIGFQGDDPKTDFRGMGMLGLRNLVYFAEKHNQLALQTLQHSHHPKYGYSYAIVGINITSMAYELMCNGLLRCHFFNNVQGRPNIEDFHNVYCYLLCEFDKFWRKSEPENVMSFSRIRGEFLKTVEDVLSFVPSASLDFEPQT